MIGDGPNTVNRIATDVVQSLARGDFTALANRFVSAGLDVRLPASGVLLVSPMAAATKDLRLLLSVGIHGDETGPIEILADVLDDLAHSPAKLAVSLMVVIGNPVAIAQEKRYIDIDLNRLFSDNRIDATATIESERADIIMQATVDFFNVTDCEKWHLDLHTAIRPSAYPRFAIVPDVIEANARGRLISWLAAAGIGAVILNSKLAPTYSAYTATRFSAVSCTAELGQVGTIGKNDPSALVEMRDALRLLIRGNSALAGSAAPDVFGVAQELIKVSDQFSMVFDQAVHNFASLEPGNLIACDGDTRYVVGDVREYVVFPNPNVKVGQRAGLMVVKRGPA